MPHRFLFNTQDGIWTGSVWGISRHQTLAPFATVISFKIWNKTTTRGRSGVSSAKERCEREGDKNMERGGDRCGEKARALTVIETALASPLVSWVAGSVPACQPVCHHHCLVFSLRPSACSLYTGSCSGLTCFLYVDIFIAAQTSPFPPDEWEGSKLTHEAYFEME